MASDEPQTRWLAGGNSVGCTQQSQYTNLNLLVSGLPVAVNALTRRSDATDTGGLDDL
jgi:hypothetical protein